MFAKFSLMLLVFQFIFSYGFLWSKPKTVATVGKILLDSFTTRGVTTTDLTAAEQMVRGIMFDKYEEKIYTKILTKIKIADYQSVINRIATRHQIPDDLKESILDGQYGEVNKELMREFKFNVGQTGRVVYGRTATIRHGDTIDLACAFFALDFKLSLDRIEDRYKSTFLFFFEKVNRVIRYEEHKLSEKEKDHMFNFFRAKAINGFIQEHPALKNSRDEL